MLNGACTKGEVLEPRAPRLRTACMHRPLEWIPICGSGLEFGNRLSRTTSCQAWAGRCLVLEKTIGTLLYCRSHESHMKVSLMRLSGFLAARGRKWIVNEVPIV